METYELLQVLIKRYPNNYELGAAVRNIHHEITDYVQKSDATVDDAVKQAVKEVIKKNFQPS
jgi:hypothetical protein